MMEKAGLKLSRRDFIRGTMAVGGMFVTGGLASSMLAGCKAANTDTPADTIYYGGPILTMVKDGERAEALAAKDGRIVAVGAKAEVMAGKGNDTKLIDLGGKDPHAGILRSTFPYCDTVS
jgi:hypothetical protein